MLILVGFAATTVVSLFLLGWLGLASIGATRSWVDTAAQWTKARGDAFYYLSRYAATRDSSNYARFNAEMDVLRGDSIARAELAKATPNVDLIYAGFRRGRAHEPDIVRMTAVARLYRSMPYSRRAMAIWAESDSTVGLLAEDGEALRAELARTAPRPAEVQRIVTDLDQLSTRFAGVERRFSQTLGEAARWSERLFLRISLVASVLLLALGTVVTIRSVHSIRRSQERYDALFERSGLGIFRTTDDGRMLAANPALARMLGYESVADLLKVDVARDLYVDATERSSVLERFRGADAELEHREVSLKRRDGSPVLVRVNGYRVAGGSPRESVFEGFIEDISHQRLLEAQLRQAQKMEAIGKLSGGVAHDFNNLLQVILSVTAMVEAQLPESDSIVRDDLDLIRDAALRGADIVKSLLAYSRQGRLSLEPIDLRRAIGETTTLLQRILPSRISVEVRFAPDVPMARADEGSVGQILLHLATNARDAMPDGGALRITVGHRSIGDDERRAKGWSTPGTFAEIVVSDTGTGMDQHTLDRVFDPFFTTKKQGEGSGLGLAMIHGLVTQQGGHVEIKSELGHGTSVWILLPAVEEPAEAATASVQLRRGGDETILVVEDESALRSLMRRVLEKAGYTVLDAPDGEAAMQALRERGGDVGLVVTDLTMPKMGGHALVAAMRVAGYETPVIVTSGYSESESGDAGALGASVPRLQKPWPIQGLLELVRSQLDEHAAR